MRVGPLDDGYVLPRFHHFVWFERGQLAGSHSGCDARGIWLDQYTLLAVYNEMTIFPHYKQGDPLYPGSGNNRVHMYGQVFVALIHQIFKVFFHIVGQQDAWANFAGTLTSRA